MDAPFYGQETGNLERGEENCPITELILHQPAVYWKGVPPGIQEWPVRESWLIDF
jgi:hypothetical protein